MTAGALEVLLHEHLIVGTRFCTLVEETNLGLRRNQVRSLCSLQRLRGHGVKQPTLVVEGLCLVEQLDDALHAWRCSHARASACTSFKAKSRYGVRVSVQLQYDVMMWFVLCCCLCLSCFQPVSSQGVGVLRSLVPTSLFECMSMGQARNPSTQRDHTLCNPCFSCPLWPCYHRMCVIARRLGSLHWLAHAAGHGYVLTHLHIWSHRFLCLTSFT